VAVADVLLVDDDEMVRAAIAGALRAAGHFVMEAPDGPTALGFVPSHKFDIAICDVHMPGMDGLGLLRHLVRESPATEVVMISSFDADPAILLHEGAVDFVLKPFEPDEFVSQRIAPIAKRRSLPCGAPSRSRLEP
jgi:CheY-like chemotaxis protein